MVCAPAPDVPGIVQSCGEAGVLGVAVLSAGFREMDEEGARREAELARVVSGFPGMRLLGPNCLGLIVPGQNLNASFAGAMPPAGRLAFLSQSGALCIAVLDWALQEGIGFSHFLSLGNAVDVDFGDLIDYLGENEDTDAILLYVESIRDARGFMAAARAFIRNKPIIVYKAGRFAASAAAAGSHTGAMAGEDAVYDAALQRAGVARVYEFGEIFNIAGLLGRQKRPRGPRLAILTNAGGPGVMAVDALAARNGELATLSPETQVGLDEVLPPYAAKTNPVDVLGDAKARRFARAAELLVQDRNVDALLVLLSPQAMTRPAGTARAVVEVAEKTKKPVLAAWLGGSSVREGLEVLTRGGVASYSTPEAAVHAFMTLVHYARNLETLHETPREVPVRFTLDRERIRTRLGEVAPEGTGNLTEVAAKEVLEAYGIPVTPTRLATSHAEAVTIAREVGFPVVAKIASPDILHKTEVGGVALHLRNEDELRGAFWRLTETARQRHPDARIDGVTVQPQAETAGAFELIVGARRDPTFGSVVMVGTGGIAAEVFGDRALGFPPLNERLACRMLESLRSWPLLRGFRGRLGVAVDSVVEVLLRFSYLVADLPRLAEFDVNPLLVSPAGALALDARAILGEPPKDPQGRPYPHLVLRPYPEEFSSEHLMRDGTPVRVRPIRPEDEPLWRQLLAACSKDSLYARFGYLAHFATHETATRYCYVDYDRELALVAEVTHQGQRRLAAVVRLVAVADRRSAEFALLVGDAWQDRGLGGLMTDACLDVAHRWGLRRITGETTTSNRRMPSVLEKLGFELTVDENSEVVTLGLDLGT